MDFFSLSIKTRKTSPCLICRHEGCAKQAALSLSVYRLLMNLLLCDLLYLFTMPADFTQQCNNIIAVYTIIFVIISGHFSFMYTIRT